MPSCQRALHPYVLASKRVWRVRVPICPRETCLACLHVHVPMRLACLRDHVLTCFCALGLTCQRTLSPYVPHVSTSLRHFCTQVSTWLASSRALMLTCLASLASHGLRDHVITCQVALSPR